MHEMALTESLVALVEEAASDTGFDRARTVVVEIGTLSAVDPEAIRFCFEAVSRGTVAEGARLEIRLIPGSGWCLDCGKMVPLTERFGACPDCGGSHVQMCAGNELRLKEVEIG